jgi:hypothetical protein
MIDACRRIYTTPQLARRGLVLTILAICATSPWIVAAEQPALAPLFINELSPPITDAQGRNRYLVDLARTAQETFSDQPQDENVWLLDTKSTQAISNLKKAASANQLQPICLTVESKTIPT